MSDRPFERAVHDWLEAGSDRTPPAAVDAVLFAIKTTPQQRDLWIPRRFNLMPAYMRLAAAVAIVVIVGVGVLAYNSRSPGVGSETPNPTVAPTGSPAPTARPTVLPLFDTADWTPYTSSRYGFSISYPPTGWTAIPGDHDWTFENDINAFKSTAPDNFQQEDQGDFGMRISVWSYTVTPGTTVERFVQAHCPFQDGEPPRCGEMADDPCEVQSGDGHCGRLWRNAIGEPTAFFLDGETVYVAALWWRSMRPWGGILERYEAFLSTMTLPAVAPAESPAAS
jgi:hypothetical protein